MQINELILGLALAFVPLAITVRAWLPHRSWLPERFRQRQTDICLVLLYLIQDIQRHRALSGAIIDGRKEFKAEREATELRLQRSLRAVMEQYGNRHKLFHQPSWRVVLGRWEALHNNWQSLDFFTSFDTHSQIVGEMLGILRSLPESLHLRLGEERIRILSEWPAIPEQVGMLRALGLHAMSSDKNGLDATKIDELVSMHLRITRRLLENINSTGANASLVTRTKRALTRVEWLLDSNNMQRYHPYTFYEEMTGVIDDWYTSTRTRLREEPRHYHWPERPGRHVSAG